VIENRFTSSTRRIFLFENIIIIAKKASKDGKESFTFKESYRVRLVNNALELIITIADK